MEIFSELVGQPQAVTLLTQVLTRQRIAPAYLFSGPAGVGKRLAAQRFAAALLTGGASPKSQSHPDLLWVEPTYLHQGQRYTAAEAEAAGVKRRSPPQIRLEQVRELARFLGRPPLTAPRLVVVIEGAEVMAEAAANALLKTLEEPGSATLILLSDNRDRLLTTIISRCQQIPFRRLSLGDMATVLQRAGAEALLQRPELLTIAQGSPGQAMAALRQWETLPEAIASAVAQPPATVNQALVTAREIAALEVPAQLWLIDYLQHQYCGDNLSDDLQSQWSASRQRLQLLERAGEHIRRFVQPRLVWEVTLMALAGADLSGAR